MKRIRSILKRKRIKSVFKGDFYIAQNTSSHFLNLIKNKNQSITKCGSLPGARARLIFQYLRKTNKDDANNVPDLAGT